MNPPYPSLLISPQLLDRLLHTRRLGKALFPEGVTISPYEVLDHDATVILVDVRGSRALFRRTERIRTLQDGVAAILDHVWGDGVLSRYAHDAGVLAGSLRDHACRHLVIDLQRRLPRGHELTFHVERERLAAFSESEEWVETLIDHPIARLSRTVIFPMARPCQQAVLQEGERRLTVPVEVLPDGRTRIRFEVFLPLPNTAYRLLWTW